MVIFIDNCNRYKANQMSILKKMAIFTATYLKKHIMTYSYHNY